MADTSSPSSVLRGFASGIPEPQARWSRGEGLGGGATTAEPKADPKSEPKSEPKPSSTSATGTTPDTDTEPKPAADTKPAEPKPDAKPKAEPKKFNPHVGKTLTQLGVPPSAVRNIKSGEPLKGVKGIVKGQWNAGQHWAGKAGEKLSKVLPKGLGKGAIKGAMKFVPGLGAAVAGYAAIKAFQRGDYVGAALNAVAMIPGPVGWIAAGASIAWELTGWGDRYSEWAPPDGVNTFMLQGEAKDVANVKEIDATIRTAQNSVFCFQEGPTGSVWDSAPPPAIKLATAEVVAEAEAWLTGISDHFAAIDKAMTDSGEQYFSEQRQSLAPHLAAMAKLKGEVRLLTDLLTAESKGAETAYAAVTEANKAARGQLASSGSLTDAGPATTMETQMQQGLSAVKTAEDKISKLWADTPPAVVLVRNTDGSTQAQAPKPQEQKPVATTPAPTVTPTTQTPAAQTPAKTETPTKKDDDNLSKILSQLGNKAQTPTSSNPLGTGGGSGLGGGSPLGGQGLGGGQGGGTPLATSKPDTKSDDEKGKKLGDDKKFGERKETEPKKLGDEKSLSTPKPEQAKAAVPNQEQKPAAVPAAAVPAPGAAAPTPAQQNAAAAAAQAEPNKEVDVKGQKTVFPDAKTAKLAEILSKADPTHPVSLADAAKSAGLTPPVPGQDPGKQIPPAEAKPGDIMVAGDKNFMLLGDGKFYDLQDYKVIGSSELPQNMGDRAGYFHLNDPNPGSQPPQGGQPGQPAAPAPTQPQGPVSPQSTNGVQNAVPNATAAPAGPTDGSQGGQSAAGASATPSGVPSVGAPGVPKPGGAGPANAGTTETGTGQGGVSSGGQALDPGAVR